jgi:hypothetical protein
MKGTYETDRPKTRGFNLCKSIEQPGNKPIDVKKGSVVNDE